MRASDDALLRSACTADGVLPESKILDWLDAKRRSQFYSVRPRPLDQLPGWRFDQLSGDLVHASGRFFSIRGIEFRVHGEVEQSWQQPIIDQPEIGVLGFVAKKIDGVLHLLVQAKMEPGNINLVQLSPTVQATRSNYTRVHGGKTPPFIEYFIERGRGRVLYDQLQSEQGTRYFRKRNRNVVLEVANPEIAISDDFIWVTIGQLQLLTRLDNVVHLDCRSILGGLVYEGEVGGHRNAEMGFGSRVLQSMCTNCNAGQHTHAEVLSWLTELKFSLQTECRFIPLKDVQGWAFKAGRIHHEDHKYFSVVGVSVEAETREVSSWSQPLINSNDGGIIALVAQMKNGLLHFLVQGRVEPGLIDIVELGPTVQCTPRNYSVHVPPYVDLVTQETDQVRVVFDSLLSEEGGRFYHSQQRHRLLELREDVDLPVSRSHCWMTMRQIQECGRYNNHLNIEMRSILACVSPLLRS